MILHELTVTPTELEATGWTVKPEGLCRDGRCVPFPDGLDSDGRVEVRAVARRLGMPLVADEAHGLWALGPASGGRVLGSARLPDVTLVDFDGNPFELGRLRGEKVVLHAWASW